MIRGPCISRLCTVIIPTKCTRVLKYLYTQCPPTCFSPLCDHLQRGKTQSEYKEVQLTELLEQIHTYEMTIITTLFKVHKYVLSVTIYVDSV
jgi:hypothetical protein